MSALPHFANLREAVESLKLNRGDQETAEPSLPKWCDSLKETITDLMNRSAEASGLPREESVKRAPGTDKFYTKDFKWANDGLETAFKDPSTDDQVLLRQSVWQGNESSSLNEAASAEGGGPMLKWPDCPGQDTDSLQAGEPASRVSVMVSKPDFRFITKRERERAGPESVEDWNSGDVFQLREPLELLEAMAMKTGPEQREIVQEVDAEGATLTVSETFGLGTHVFDRFAPGSPPEKQGAGLLDVSVKIEGRAGWTRDTTAGDSSGTQEDEMGRAIHPSLAAFSHGGHLLLEHDRKSVEGVLPRSNGSASQPLSYKSDTLSHCFQGIETLSMPVFDVPQAGDGASSTDVPMWETPLRVAMDGNDPDNLGYIQATSGFSFERPRDFQIPEGAVRARIVDEDALYGALADMEGASRIRLTTSFYDWSPSAEILARQSYALGPVNVEWLNEAGDSVGQGELNATGWIETAAGFLGSDSHLLLNLEDK